MSTSHYVLWLLHLASLVHSSPAPTKVQHVARQATTTKGSPDSRFTGTWSHGAECSTNDLISYTKSRLLNPPAASPLPPNFKLTDWCSSFLAQTDLSVVSTTAPQVSTKTIWVQKRESVTSTDLSSPTLTLRCPSPSPNMECGWDGTPAVFATLNCPGTDPDSDPRVPGPCEAPTYYDRRVGPEQCHQICLADSKCKSYQIDAQGYWPCRIFYIPLGDNAANVPSPSPNGQIWWDRNCQMHLPAQCENEPARRTAAPLEVEPRVAHVLQPVITAAPTFDVKPRLENRDVDAPKYIRDIMGVYPQGLTPACSCLITEARQVMSATTTVRVETWTSTTTITKTYTSTDSFTTTPHRTTTVVSVS